MRIDRDLLPASTDDLLRRLGVIEARGPFDSALAATALFAAGVLLGTGLSLLLLSRPSEQSSIPSEDARGVHPLKGM